MQAGLEYLWHLLLEEQFRDADRFQESDSITRRRSLGAGPAF
jgi:hypothetical protein